MLALNLDDAKRYIDLGYSLVGLGSDTSLLKKAALEALGNVK